MPRQWKISSTDNVFDDIVVTKKRGLEVMKNWRTSYEQAGWKCYSTDKGSAVIAKPPTWSENPAPWSRHAITLREVVSDGSP